MRTPPQLPAAKVEIDPSFFTELKNYSRHDVVCDLPSPDLHRALVGVGLAAIDSGGKRIGAGAVRVIINELCRHQFSACHLAAARFLGKYGLEQGEELAEAGQVTSAHELELPTGPFKTKTKRTAKET